MSAGLFFTEAPAGTGAPRDYGLGARPGDNGRDGNGIRSIEQIPNTFELLVALDDGRALIFPLPAGPVGQDGTTPEFITGNVTYGTRDTLPQLILRRLALGLFAVDLTLPDLTAATASAAAAFASEQSAASSKTAAAGSAVAAAASAIQADQKSALAVGAAADAIAAYDSFDDRYLGARAADPALDNDGNALLVGALYFNSATKKMRVWDGFDWQVAYAQITGGVQSFKGRDGAVSPMAGDYAVADVTGLPAALSSKLEAGSSTITLLQATVSSLRKDILLTELLVAEAKGDRVNMSAGIVDPYGDTSDFILSDAAFDLATKVARLAPLAAYEPRAFGTFAANDQANVVQAANGASGAYLLDIVFNSLRVGNTYVSLPANSWIEGRFTGPPIRSVELQFYINSAGTFQFSITDAGGGVTLANFTLTAGSTGGWVRKLVDLSSPALAGIRVNVGATGSSNYLHYVRGYAAKSGDFVQATSMTGFGASYTNVSDGNLYTTAIAGNGSPYRYDIDLGVSRALGLLVMYGHDRDKWFSFSIKGSNDGVTWSQALVDGPNTTPASESYDKATWPYQLPGSGTAYRYYRLEQTLNAVSYTTRRHTAFGFALDPSVSPTITSNTFGAAATPTAARLGAQIKRPNGANFSDLIGEVSRNHGASWTAVPLALAGTQTDGFDFVEGLVDISGQPIGQSMRYRLRSQNKATIEIGGALLQWS